MPVLLVLFGLSVGAVAFTFWQESQRRARARQGRPLPQPGALDAPVDVEFLGDRAVVKVYYENRAYSPHVYWREVFLGSSGGFGSVPPAVGWGRNLARSRGADV